MNMIDQLLEKYESPGKGGERYLPLKEAKRLVEEYSQRGIAVIGIDFVHIRGGGIHPQVPINSADWSAFLQAGRWQEVVAQCHEASLQVLQREEERALEQFCSFVLYSEEEWTASSRDRLSS